MLQRKIYDIKALDVDTSKKSVKIAFAQMDTVDRDGDVFDVSAFTKSIQERGPSGTNEIWHLADHERKLRASLGKFNTVQVEGKYLVGQNSYREKLWLWREVAWPLYESGDITQHSIGFNTVTEQKSQDGKYNIIKEAQVWEGSTVLWGAQPDTPTMNVVKEFLSGKKESVVDYMEFIIKNLQEGKYSGENESLLLLELKEISGLFLPKETPQKVILPDESSQDLQKLKEAIQLITLKNSLYGN